MWGIKWIMVRKQLRWRSFCISCECPNELLEPTCGVTPQQLIDEYGDPCHYFYDEGRKSIDEKDYTAFTLWGLQNLFRYQDMSTINDCLSRSRGLYAPAVRLLRDKSNTRKTKRPHSKPPPGQCLAFLKEEAFVNLEDEVKRLLAKDESNTSLANHPKPLRTRERNWRQREQGED